MQTTHRIEASWCEGSGDLWCPLPGADLLYVVSCYAGVDGWKVLEQYLLAGLAHNPRLEALLIFSRNGIEQSGGQALLVAMRAFLVGMPNVAGIDIGVVDEVKNQKLFHPKAHASRAGAQTRVVVGSANLTRGGMRSHYEMAAVSENDPAVWADFEGAMKALLKDAGSLRNEDDFRALCSHTVRPTWPSSAGSQVPDAPRTPLETGVLDLPTSHVTDGLVEARRTVAAFFSLGYKLSRSTGTLEFSTKVALSKLRRAGILESTGKTELSDNVSMDNGSGDLTVKLFSPGFERKIERFKHGVGTIFGATTVVLAGITWAPQDWVHALRETWETRIMALNIDSLPGEAEAFGPLLAAEFAPDGPGFLRLEKDKGLAIAPLQEWKRDAACEILGLAHFPEVMTPALRRQVALAAAEDLRRKLEGVVKLASISENFAHLRNLPRPASVFMPSDGDAVEILADVLILAAAWHNESGKGAKNALAERFEMMLMCSPTQGMVDEAQRWKQQLSRQPLPTVEQQAAMLSHAWERFRNWFREDVLDARYFRYLPRSLQQTEDDPGLNRSNE